jgi:pilus assembly protein CpaF
MEKTITDTKLDLEADIAGIKANLAEDYFELKTNIHTRLLDMLDLSLLDTLEPDVLHSQIGRMVEKILLLEESSIPLNSIEKKVLVAEIQAEVLGLGPLEPFLKDPSISDILVNNYKQIYIERFGKLERTQARFKDDAHLRRIIDKIVSFVGRRIDESSPMVDARLEDGSRVNAIIPPLALDGPVLSIRRFSVDPLEMHDLIELKSLVPGVAALVQGIVQAKLNVLISGGTGSGKTTMLNVLSRFIPENERIVVIEDAAELQLKQDHIVRLETRPANIEGTGEVSQRDLVKNSLRMRPDRIIVGEVRGQEALDMLQAMNTGHEGSLTTIHANTPRDALLRLETMVAMANFDIPSDFVRKYISSALDIVIQLERMADGTRKLVSLQEITGMEGNVVTMQEIFSFQQTSVDEEGNVHGKFVFSGIRPRFMDKFQVAGIRIPNSVLDPSKVEQV